MSTGWSREFFIRRFSATTFFVMSYTKIWVHAVICTKRRRPFLKGDAKKKIIEHIKSNALQKGIHIDTINGHHEHLHILLKLKADMSIATAMQLIKGESSFWMNKEKIIDERFEWCIDYYAASVDEASIPRVRNYINNQEIHHGSQTFEQEENDLVKMYDLQQLKDNNS
jgi:putative transposase